MKKYLKDYLPDSKVTDKGKVINEVKYTGDYYEYRLSSAEYKKMRIIILEASVITTFIFVATGFLNNSGSRCIYVLLPYICTFLPLTYLFRSYIRIPKEMQRMEYAIYDKCYNRVKFSIVGIIAASITTVMGDIIFIIRNAKDIAFIKEVSFCIANIVIVVISTLLLIYHNRIVCEKQ